MLNKWVSPLKDCATEKKFDTRDYCTKTDLDIDEKEKEKATGTQPWIG